MVIRGLLPLRTVGLAIGLGGIVAAAAAAVSLLTAEGQAIDYIGVLVLVVLPLGAGGLYFTAKSTESIAITDRTLQLRRGWWQIRAIPWEEIEAIDLASDPITVVPVVTLKSGERLRARGGSSLTARRRSAAFRTYSEVQSRIPQIGDELSGAT